MDWSPPSDAKDEMRRRAHKMGYRVGLVVGLVVMCLGIAYTIAKVCFSPKMFLLFWSFSLAACIAACLVGYWSYKLSYQLQQGGR